MNSLGINNFGPWYLNLLPVHDSFEEITSIFDFINNVINDNSISEFQGNSKEVQFINYGSTQLVFVVTIDNKKQYTLLVNQPATLYGIGKEEFTNLNILNNISPEIVIKPLHYINNKYRELYITPYYYQARCIGVSTDKWGVWVPEPLYHFKEFTDSERSIINSVMVSILIKLYDEKNNKALSECRLDGGDFMLYKGFDNNEINVDNIFKNIKLIAARKLISITLDEYINNLVYELYGNNDKNKIIGKSLRKPFTMEEIENGIELGLKLRSNSKRKILK